MILSIFLLLDPEQFIGCYDELAYCSTYVDMYGCGMEEHGLQYALTMLSFCRPSCQKKYKKMAEIPEEIKRLLGVEDVVEDMFGMRYLAIIVFEFTFFFLFLKF